MSSGIQNLDSQQRNEICQKLQESYYRLLDPADLQGHDESEMSERIVEHYALATNRTKGEVNIDVVDFEDSSLLIIVTDDMPFLVDSVMAEIVKEALAIRLVIHPTYVVTRDMSTGELVDVIDVPTNVAVSSGDTATLPNLSALKTGENQTTVIESWIAIELGKIDDAQRATLIERLGKVLHDVKLAVEDWPRMRFAAREAVKALKDVPAGSGVANIDQAEEFLTWLDEGNFTFLGYREYELREVEGHNALEVVPESGLGVLRDAPSSKPVQLLTDAGDAKAREKDPLIITKANSRSTVHRGSWLDYVGVKKFDAEGNVTGERRFIGLFATRAYTTSVRDIPVIKDKVAAVLKNCGFPADSHSGKDLVTILETYPRDELFQMSTAEMEEAAIGILRLQERRQTRVFLRPDVYGRFMSAVVFLPRDRYTTNVRLRMEAELRRVFNAESIDFEARMSDSALTRVFFRIRLPRGAKVSDVSASELERKLAAATRSWSEGIEEVSRQRFDVATARDLSARWSEAFPAAYRVDYEVEDAIDDIERLRQAAQSENGVPVLHVYVPKETPAEEGNFARLLVYLKEPQSLTQLLPTLQNMGLEVMDEKPYEVTPAGEDSMYIYDLGLRYPDGVDPVDAATLLEEGFAAGVTGQSESDSFDRLILRESLPWRSVAMLRAYAKYLGQLGSQSSYGFLADNLVANPEVSKALVALFEASFDPAVDEADRPARIEAARAELSAGLEKVPTLDADRVLRSLAELIECTLRTNYFQGKDYFSFKINTRKVSGAPFPRPEFEVWVYSPQVEGVHLRFGKVARGGLRWSDRREDFRTEILGLVKAQTVKNAVIVPTGAKGGFFPKQLPDPAVDRNAWLEEGKSSYTTFISGLLDITDNLEDQGGAQAVVPPQNVVRHDADDTYLVVAADKGTATFSDLANSISAQYNFWLGDAFASGGSVGYDHKAMGITARGAWESVKSHFAEFNVDTQTQDFTVAGIGDMSGDVFGNGMLLSEHIRLIAAFDHRHIFLDPNPDAASSFQERKRLFELPRSSWDDYNRDLISAGGGVYPRSVKSVPISPEVRAALDLGADVTSMSPPDLLQAILRAPADLLYNGGIGTYVKASSESNLEVGDKANDAIRVNGNELRVKVVGEGGNLGLTQRGRIEAALGGVLINTDAIDNSAGVDCSDHEVNIKILVDQMVTQGKLPGEERAAFIESMTDNVATLVLADNIDQNMLLLNDKYQVKEWSPSYERFMDWLEANAGLNRELEALPTTNALRKRVDKGAGLTTPELSVLAAYAKIELAKALVDSDLADDPFFVDTLAAYFPAQIGERFAAELADHPLRKEIICTIVANDMINIGGITFAFRVMEETSVNEAQVARAFVALNEIFGFERFAQAMLQLPKDFPTEQWCRINLDARRLLDRATRWFINHSANTGPVQTEIDRFGPVVQELSPRLMQLLQGNDLERVEAALGTGREWGLPEELAVRWADQFESYTLLDITLIAERAEESPASIAEIYYRVYDQFNVDALLERITSLPRKDRWQALARAALRDDLYSTVADITLDIARTTPADAAEGAQERIDVWVEANQDRLQRTKAIFTEVNKLVNDDMASLSVALRSLRSIVQH